MTDEHHVIIGDSLTAGNYGIGFRQFLPPSFSCYGIDGDTCSHIFFRAIALCKKGVIGHNSTLFIEGGANDLLLPFAMERNETWAAYGKTLLHNQFLPIHNVDHFVSMVQEHILLLKNYHSLSSLVICSLPIIGEQLHSKLHLLIQEFNASLKKITNTLGCLWCDIYHPVTELIISQQSTFSDYLLESPQELISDREHLAIDPLNDMVLSAQRGLCATVDGVHPNRVGASIIAHTIRKAIP